MTTVSGLARSTGVSLALCLLAVGAPASASPYRWTIHAGLTASDLADKADVKVASVTDPHANISTTVTTSPSVDVMWYLNQHFAAAVSVGLPPLTTVKGKGSLEPFGTLLKSRSGASSASLQYHWTVGRLQPYVGVGAAYLHVFRTRGVAVTNAKGTDDLGPMTQIGADLWLRKRWGIFFDVKKAWLTTRLNGTVGGVSAVSTVRSNPLAATAGIAVKF